MAIVFGTYNVLSNFMITSLLTVYSKVSFFSVSEFCVSKQNQSSIKMFLKHKKTWVESIYYTQHKICKHLIFFAHSLSLSIFLCLSLSLRLFCARRTNQEKHAKIDCYCESLEMNLITKTDDNVVMP
jgi:hypothetical protein